jgi:hypothetical protein
MSIAVIAVVMVVDFVAYPPGQFLLLVDAVVRDDIFFGHGAYLHVRGHQTRPSGILIKHIILLPYHRQATGS